MGCDFKSIISWTPKGKKQVFFGYTLILIKSHIREHKKCIISVKEENKRARRVLTEKCGFVLANLLFKQILTDLRNENTEQIKTENKSYQTYGNLI